MYQAEGAAHHTLRTLTGADPQLLPTNHREFASKVGEKTSEASHARDLTTKARQKTVSDHERKIDQPTGSRRGGGALCVDPSETKNGHG